MQHLTVNPPKNVKPSLNNSPKHRPNLNNLRDRLPKKTKFFSLMSKIQIQ